MKIFVFVLIIAFSSTVIAKYDLDLVKAFAQFQKNFGKQYKNQEEINEKFAIFSQNMLNVSKMNEEKKMSNDEALFGITQFSDMTPEEFEKKYLTYQPQKRNPQNNLRESSSIPDKVDWVAQGAVNPVVNAQGNQYVANVQMIEGAARASGKYPLIKLSVQQLVDCVQSPSQVEDYILKNGLESAENYKPGKPCGYDPSRVAVHVHSFGHVKKGEDNLKNQTSYRPLMVCVAANTFQTYRSGILSNCGDKINHCLELVGYDFASTPAYWRLQNSWGTSWGEQGYIRIAVGKDLCKISDLASFAVV